MLLSYSSNAGAAKEQLKSAASTKLCKTFMAQNKTRFAIFVNFSNLFLALIKLSKLSSVLYENIEQDICTT